MFGRKQILSVLRVLGERLECRHNEQMSLMERLERKLNIMAQTQAEIVASLKTVTAQLAKIGTESAATLQKVTDLQAIIDAGGGVGGTVSQELVDAVAALQVQAQAVDDLVPDAPTPPM